MRSARKIEVDATVVGAGVLDIDAALNEVERGDLFRGLAYRRLHEAAAQINDVATGFGLDVDQRRRLGEILDSVLPGPPLPLRKLNVIWPKRPMGAALEFSRPVMKQYFDNGINDAADYLGLQGGPPDLADLPLADEFIDGLV